MPQKVRIIYVKEFNDLYVLLWSVYICVWHWAHFLQVKVGMNEAAMQTETA